MLMKWLEDGNMSSTLWTLFRERKVKLDSHSDSDGIWSEVFAQTFPVTFSGRSW